MDPRKLIRQQVLDAIVNSCNENKESIITNEEVAEIIGKKPGTIAMHLTILEKEGTISRTQKSIRDEKGHIKGCTRTIKVLKEKADELPEKIWCTPGVNDIATTHSEIIQFLVNKEDSYKYSHGSEKKIKIKCPDCGYEAEKMVIELCNSGFNCPICGDKISYPNKFIRAFLEQLPIQNLKFEYKDEWTKGKIYDNYFEYNKQKYLVEVDGNQHDRDTQWSTFEYQQENDNLKTQLAENNNYHLIRLSCGRSRNYKIEETLKESEFAQLFDLSNINWQICREKAISNKYIEICNYFNDNPDMPNYQITENLKISRETLTTALKRGVELGIIDYNANEKRARMTSLARQKNK